ncbi:Coiled-coil domain-containing protein 51 [Trichostrongylus colubriformis]|uniref:Coiled-coil domain-containing protein 51 n=1 Tax=Trichostrongylus colubriformis TaxID=6319 RepID=A0AAN8IWL0_TRICO
MFRGPSALLSIPRLCRCVSSVPVAAPTARAGRIRHKIEQWVEAYEDFIGVKAVKEAQAGVMMWEEKLSDAQLARRDKQAEIKGLQSRLKEIHTELDRTSRGEDKYLHLLTEEHAAIKKERKLLEEFEGLEVAEREAFHQLSNRVRASHERERERAEKTKWWSVSASLIGATLGIIGATISNEVRMRRLREMLPLGGAKMSEMSRLIAEQNAKVTSFITEMRDVMKLDSVKLEPSHASFENVSDEKIIATIREENARLSAQMEEISRLARLEASLNADPNAVVYVGSDMERLLDQTEKNLESKMKLQTLLSVVALYAAIGVAVPLLFATLRGG